MIAIVIIHEGGILVCINQLAYEWIDNTVWGILKLILESNPICNLVNIISSASFRRKFSVKRNTACGFSKLQTMKFNSNNVVFGSVAYVHLIILQQYHT